MEELGTWRRALTERTPARTLAQESPAICRWAEELCLESRLDAERGGFMKREKKDSEVHEIDRGMSSPTIILAEIAEEDSSSREGVETDGEPPQDSTDSKIPGRGHQRPDAHDEAITIDCFSTRTLPICDLAETLSKGKPKK